MSTGTCRSDSEYDHILTDGIDICLLSERLWFDLLSINGMADTVFIYVYELRILYLPWQVPVHNPRFAL